MCVCTLCVCVFVCVSAVRRRVLCSSSRVLPSGFLLCLVLGSSFRRAVCDGTDACTVRAMRVTLFCARIILTVCVD